MNKFSVSVVIPNFNGKDLLEKNLPFVLKAKNNPSNNIAEVIVVDDASSDDSVKLVVNKFPQVRIIKHKINRGFSAGVNTGVRMAKGNLVVLLNTDVEPSENFLEAVFKHFNNSHVFAVSLHEEGFGWAKASFKGGFIELGMGSESENSHRTFYVSAGSGVFRRDVWLELGGMDEKLLSPFYWEDVDLCFRAEKRGYINLWESEGRVRHKHESTIGKLPGKFVLRIKERNQLLVIWKNIHSKTFIRSHVTGVLRRISRHPGYLKVILMAIGKIPVVLSHRRKEIKLSKVSDEVVFMRHK